MSTDDAPPPPHASPIEARFRATMPVLGRVLFLCAAGMLGPLAVSAAREGTDRLAIGASIALCGTIGLLLFWHSRRQQIELRQRDAILALVGGWLGMGVLGAVPYVLAGVLSPIDALFESVSGFTTTGASVIADVESLPHGLLLWRAMTHWLGGMGILVLAVGVLPAFGGMTYALLKAEAPSFESDRIYPRMVQTARALFGVYVILNSALALLLLAGGMNLFDAVTHAVGTIATGGFSTRNASVSAYNSLYIEVVIIAFMFLSSIPFGAHHRGLRQPSAYLKSAQLRLHAKIIVIACLSLALELWARGVYTTFGSALRNGTFQLTSLITSTGFGTANSSLWTPFAQLILVMAMLVGGCTGSTSGGIKTFRLAVVGRLVSRQMFLAVNPRAVRPIYIGDQMVDERLARSTGTFPGVYLAVTALGALALTLFKVDVVSAFSGAAAMMGGVGPGLGKLGPMDNYGWLPGGAKLVCVALMLLGRLEIYTLVVVFTRHFWRR